MGNSRRFLIVTGLLLLALTLLVAPAQSQRPQTLATLPQAIAQKTEVEPEVVDKVLAALGPALTEQLAAGREVALPGLGKFRVVRIGESRDLIDGRPVTTPASNQIEFIPEGAVVGAANSADAKPATTVPPFTYVPIPGRTPTVKVPSGRSPSTRSR